MKKIHFLLLLVCIATAGLTTSCNKKKADPHVPPTVTLNTAAGYAYKDTTIGLQDTLKVGVTAVKTEDDLRTYNVSTAYDGASTTTTFYNYVVSTQEYTGFTKDVNIIARNQAGSEKWIFSVVDRDGNITQKSFVVTVQ